MSREDAVRFIAEHHAAIERAISSIARRRALSPDETARFSASTYESLTLDDFAVVRRFQGLSSPITWLTVVISLIFRDFRQRERESGSTAAWLQSTTVTDQSLGNRVRSLYADRNPTLPDLHELLVIAAGVVVGTARMEAFAGLAWALFVPADAYDMVATAARFAAGERNGTRFWSSADGDFATHLATEWSAATLSITTTTGDPIPAASVVIIDAVHASGRELPRWLVVDFRIDASAVGATLAPRKSAGGGAAPTPRRPADEPPLSA